MSDPTSEADQTPQTLFHIEVFLRMHGTYRDLLAVDEIILHTDMTDDAKQLAVNQIFENIKNQKGGSLHG